MRLTMVGTGYVGLVTGTCLADLGFQILCLDTDPARVKLLQSGGVPIYEPGLDAMIARNHREGRIHFTADAAQAVAHGDVIFIAVGTPPQEDGSADLRHVLDVAEQIGLIETMWSAYFTVEYKDVAAFTVLIIVLIFMPQGLLGKPEVEKV